MTEFREALRLNPNDFHAHFYVGVELESMGDRDGALKEYREAYELNSKDSSYKEAYDRLLQQVNQ
jgi:Flp pilus assembly protein TadD